ncbi:MAG: hypothetical protein IJQ80_03800, partial [Clostridia bacterium]|nr:hypothetical protein [Clostridia bacterium]
VYEYEYDDNGYQTHYSSKYYDSEGEVKYTYEAEHELTYDGGNLIKDAQTVTYWSSYSDDDSTDVQESVTEYEYDGKGRLTLQTATDSEGNKSVTEYSYDGKGNMTKTVTTGDKEESNNSTELSYDSKGRITSTKSTSADDTVLTYEIKYDDAGHPSKITMINSGEDGEDKEETYQYKFDSKGNMTSKIYTDPENKDTTYEYEYSDGECTKMIRTDPDGKVTTYEYEDHVYYRTVIDDYQWGPIMKVLYKNAGNYVYLSQYING